MSYKLDRFGNITRIADGATLPVKWVNGAAVYADSASVLVIEFRVWVALGNTPASADTVAVADQGDIDLINKQMKAIALLLRTYTNQTRAGVTTPVTVPALKADFKTAFDSLP